MSSNKSKTLVISVSGGLVTTIEGGDPEQRIKEPARWIKTDGTMEVVSPKDGKYFQLEELHEFVGGYIEIKRLQGQVTDKFMVLNDEGKLSHMNLPKNDIATDIYCAFHAPDWIAGDVLVCEVEQIE